MLPYTHEDVLRLQPSVKIEHTLSKRGSLKLRELLGGVEKVATLGALTGSQAVQYVRAGLKAIYLSGWQVAADNNESLQTYPDQSLYPNHSAIQLVKRINNAFTRADLVDKADGISLTDWYAPIVADLEAGFGGVLSTYELTKGMIEAGASGIHLEDQDSSQKKCGHLGGKVIVPQKDFIQKLIAANLARDVAEVPLVIVARTDALAVEGMESAISRALAYAPYCDLLWMETPNPSLKDAKAFADAIHAVYPDKWLAYNCSPSFNWKKHLQDHELYGFQNRLFEMGYKFQFVTLAGWHLLQRESFRLAKNYSSLGMAAYANLQEQEFMDQIAGYTAVQHQREVGTKYFDQVLSAINPKAETAMKGSTEEEQF